jgi:hypothetical protein
VGTRQQCGWHALHPLSQAAPQKGLDQAQSAAQNSQLGSGGGCRWTRLASRLQKAASLGVFDGHHLTGCALLHKLDTCARAAVVTAYDASFSGGDTANRVAAQMVRRVGTFAHDAPEQCKGTVVFQGYCGRTLLPEEVKRLLLYAAQETTTLYFSAGATLRASTGAAHHAVSPADHTTMRSTLDVHAGRALPPR